MQFKYLLFNLITTYFIGYHYNEINDNEYSHIDVQYLQIRCITYKNLSKYCIFDVLECPAVS